MSPVRGDYDIVAILGSSRSLATLVDIVEALPASFPAAIVIAHHFPGSHGYLARMIRRRTTLPVRVVENGTTLEPAHVYVAPENHHIRVGAKRVFVIDDSPPIRFLRPTGDALFTSVAEAFGSRAIGVVLSGLGSDGAVGVRKLRDCGATVVVQDPSTTPAGAMPHAAIATGGAHFIVEPGIIAAAITTLVTVSGAAGHFGVSETVAA